jgi:hypothetical protein
MVTKILGYVLAIVGVVGIAAWAVPQIKAAIPFLVDVQDLMLIIVSIVVALIGLFFIVKMGGGKKAHEVPIYQGKNVVGYRRQ